MSIALLHGFLGIPVHIIPVLHHVRHLVTVLIPLALPVVRQHILAVVEQRGLHIDRDSHIVLGAVYRRLIGIPCIL